MQLLLPNLVYSAGVRLSLSHQGVFLHDRRRHLKNDWYLTTTSGGAVVFHRDNDEQQLTTGLHHAEAERLVAWLEVTRPRLQHGDNPLFGGVIAGNTLIPPYPGARSLPGWTPDWAKARMDGLHLLLPLEYSTFYLRLRPHSVAWNRGGALDDVPLHRVVAIRYTPDGDVSLQLDDGTGFTRRLNTAQHLVVRLVSVLRAFVRRHVAAPDNVPEALLNLLQTGR